MAVFKRAVKEVNAAYPADFNQLDNIKAIVRENCLAAELPGRDIHALQLVVEEVASNIIRHAYKFQKGQIRLRLVIYKNVIVLSLIDTGRSFQPNFTGTVNLEKLIETGRKGGLGFYMLQKIMDSVEYISAGGYNEMRMMKRLKPSFGGIGSLGRMVPLRVKFSLSTFAVLAVIIGVSYYFINHQTTQRQLANLDDKISALGATIADQSAGFMLNRRSDVEFDELIVSYLRANSELRLLVITDLNGLVMAHSEDIKNIRKPFKIPEGLGLVGQDKQSAIVSHTPDLNYKGVPVMAGLQNIGNVHITYTTSYLKEQLSQARIATVRLTLVLFLFGLLGIYLMSNYFVEPIAKITRRVRRFTSGDLESELPLEGADEFFEISKAFNQMTTRLNEEKKSVVERERLAKEIEVASQIQKTLLPEGISSFPGLEIDSYYKAASRIGGDLYDAFDIGGNKYCIVVADVSGKGIPASLVMSMLRTVIRIYAMGGVSAKEVLVKVDSYLKGNIPPGVFITLCLLIYDSAERKISMVSAGHNPLLIVRNNSEKVERINPSGMPLGLPESESKSYADTLEEAEVALNEGDSFVVYTDGVTEASNEQGQLMGVEEFEKCFAVSIKASPESSAHAMTHYLVEALNEFAGGKDFADDLTFIVARSVSKIDVSNEENELVEAAIGESD